MEPWTESEYHESMLNVWVMAFGPKYKESISGSLEIQSVYMSMCSSSRKICLWPMWQQKVSACSHRSRERGTSGLVGHFVLFRFYMMRLYLVMDKVLLWTYLLTAVFLCSKWLLYSAIFIFVVKVCSHMMMIKFVWIKPVL